MNFLIFEILFSHQFSCKIVLVRQIEFGFMFFRFSNYFTEKENKDRIIHTLDPFPHPITLYEVIGFFPSIILIILYMLVNMNRFACFLCLN